MLSWWFSISWERLEYLYQISWLYIQQLLRHFTQSHKCEPHGGARGKVRGSQSHSNSSSEVMNDCTFSWQFHPIVVEIFKSGPKWRTDQHSCRWCWYAKMYFVRKSLFSQKLYWVNDQNTITTGIMSAPLRQNKKQWIDILRLIDSWQLCNLAFWKQQICRKATNTVC